MVNWLTENLKNLGFSRNKRNDNRVIGEVHVYHHQAAPATAAHASYGDQHRLSLPMSYSGYPHVGMGYVAPAYIQPPPSQQNNNHSSNGFSEVSAFSSMPNLQMPKFESPFKKKKQKRKKKVMIEHNFQPIPDCIVDNDVDMPTEVDMQELWRTRRTSTMTRLARSMQNLSMKDPEWEGFRSTNGRHHF